MAVLTKDKELNMLNPGEVREFPVIASDIIYKGALVGVDATGFAEPAADTTGLAFLGIAVGKADNSSGSSGDINVEVFTIGSFRIVGVGIVQGDLGKVLYVVDDSSVDDGAADNFVAVGTLEEFVSATDVWVRLHVGAAQPLA